MLRLNSRLKLLLLAFIYFPGTVMHEGAHYLTAKLLRVPTGRVTLIPRFLDNGLELGHVQIGRVDFVRRFLVGVAPLIFGLIILCAALYLILTRTNSVATNLILSYMVLTALNSMVLSKSDLRGAWKFILLVLGIALVALYTLHLNV